MRELKEELKPKDFVLPDQFVDRTNRGRQMTFLSNGIVGHISFAQPTCEELSQAVFDAAESAHVCIHKGGTYINMEGPAFSTRAESHLYRSWGWILLA